MESVFAKTKWVTCSFLLGHLWNGILYVSSSFLLKYKNSAPCSARKLFAGLFTPLTHCSLTWTWRVFALSGCGTAECDVCDSFVCSRAWCRNKITGNSSQILASQKAIWNAVERPQCVLCGEVFSNESLKMNKLDRHLQMNHPQHRYKVFHVQGRDSAVYPTWYVHVLWGDDKLDYPTPFFSILMQIQTPKHLYWRFF